VTAPVARRAAALVVGLVAALTSLTACSSSDDVALRVDGWELSHEELADQLNQIAANAGYLEARAASGAETRPYAPGSTTDFDPEFVAEFLNERVTFELARAELARRAVTPTDADRQRALEVVTQGLSATPVADGVDPAGQAVLDAFGSYGDVLLDGVTDLTTLQRVLVGDAPRDQRLLALYDQLGTDFSTQACVRSILVIPGDASQFAETGQLPQATEEEVAAARAEADAIVARLRAGADFAEEARASSDDPSTNEEGGDEGCGPEGKFLTEVDAAVWAQEVGVVGDPVRSDVGWHVLLVTDRRQFSSEELQAQLGTRLDEQDASVLQQWVNGATRSSDVSVSDRYGSWDAELGLVVPPAGEAELQPLTPEELEQLAPSSTAAG
jgi:hypothetical protein